MKGILFKPWKIKFIAEHPDMELQTRRVIKLHGKAYEFMREHGYDSLQHDEVIYPDGGGNWIGWDKDAPGLAEFTKKAYPNGEGFKSPYQVGEVVYIKEAYRCTNIDLRDLDKELQRTEVEYKDGTRLWRLRPRNKKITIPDKWHSPMMMPAWAARYFIKIIDVRPERLQEITHDDAIAEGAEYMPNASPREQRLSAAQIVFAGLWDSINPKYPWESNPWVWRYVLEYIDA